DLKQIIVTVGWAENRSMEDRNDLDPANVNWVREVFWKEVQLKTLVSKPKPREGSCCVPPEIGSPILIDMNTGNEISTSLQTLEACTDLKVRIRVDDMCPLSNLIVTINYLGYGETDTRTIPMENLGGLGYYEAIIPSSETQNYDGACEIDEPNGNGDLSIWVVATDQYIDPNCPPGSSRTTRSVSIPLDIRDTSVPSIEDYTNPIVIRPGGGGPACHAKVFAVIYDMCNGIQGINLGLVTCEIAPMDENGLWSETEMMELPLSTQSGDTFTWMIDELYIRDHSNPNTDPTAPTDDKPDIYYRITAYDNCDHYTIVWSTLTVQDEDRNAPLIAPIATAGCQPWGSTARFEFWSSDECAVQYAGLYIRNRGLPNTKTIPYSFSSPPIPDSVVHVYVDVPPSEIDSPDDLVVQYWSEDGSLQRRVTEEYIFYFDNAITWDIDDIQSSGTEGESYDTVTITVQNRRSQPTYLKTLYIGEPTRKEVYNVSWGNTITVLPYIDRITIESLSDSTSGVLWDWELSNPSPGSRDRAPVYLDLLSADIELRKLDPNERVIIKLHFVDAMSDTPLSANPIDMNNLHFVIKLIGDESFEYGCTNTFDFYTTGNSCPIADAGKDQLFCTTVGHPMKVGSTFYFHAWNSFDPDQDPLLFTWDFGDGTTGSDTWTYHVYDSTGMKTVTLAVSDGLCISYDSIYVKVYENEPPVARMWVRPNPASIGYPVEFGGWNSYDPNCEQWFGPGLSYDWDFGDGDTGVGSWVSHSYVNTGVYTVTLTVTDSDSATNSISTELEILDSGCFLTTVSGWPSTFNGHVGTPINFWGSVGDGVAPYIFNWNFGDGTSAPGQDTTHTYNTEGTYEVRLTVVDSTGCIGSNTFYITINPAGAMICDFAAVCGGTRDYGNIDNLFVNSSAVNLEAEVSGGFPGYWYSWTIGNAVPNFSSDAAVPNVIFTTSGTSDVILQVWDSSSGNCLRTKEAYVSDIDPTGFKEINGSEMTVYFINYGSNINVNRLDITSSSFPPGGKITSVSLNGTMIWTGNAAPPIVINSLVNIPVGYNTLVITASKNFQETNNLSVQFTSASPCGGTDLFIAP
ncbi:MAG TPA: PKD domain-containing protein, partial [Firmicutes bacterium]|nr:PKD domain-containing protein [Bacillota bacterium]